MIQTYTPLSCSLYDELESFATGKTAVKIKQLNSSEEITAVIVDVFSKDSAEFIKLESGNIFRLDEIESVNGKAYSRKY